MSEKDQQTNLVIPLADAKATEQFGVDLAMALRPGLSIFLCGELGSGKTTLARALIRQLAGDIDLEVPSPTFALVQHYQINANHAISSINHADLYRVGDLSEIEELGISSPNEHGLTLIEWPEIGRLVLDKPDLEIILSDDGAGRVANLTGSTQLIGLLERSISISQFLIKNWDDGKPVSGCVTRHHLLGDASTRAYETASLDGKQKILMNAPRRPDGPPVRNGEPYSKIAHLAEDVSAFVGVAGILDQLDMRIPRIYGEDLDRGFLLIEDLGSSLIITDDRQPIAERYLAGMEMLSQLHDQSAIRTFKLSSGATHIIPDYDHAAMGIETELLLDWYAPRFKGAKLSQAEQQGFQEIWRDLFDILADSEKHIILRDYHSPNIIWQDKASDSHRIGLIDFQDAVFGPTAYDVASLAQDARIDISDQLESELLEHYILFSSQRSGFNEQNFRRDFAIMAAQRATKILGIFVRLDERDGKPHYLHHLPRLQHYLQRCFRHPVLEPYRNWYESVIEKE